MRLIDTEKLLHQGYDYVVDGIAYDSCNKSMDIEDIPIVQAIPIDKVKQAREDIIATHDSTLAIIEILDNLIAESEGE